MERSELEREYDELSQKLSSGAFLGDAAKLAEASRKLKTLGDELAQAKEEEKRAARRKEAERILAEENDPELRALAEEELAQMEREKRRERRHNTDAGKETAIMEIRPGTGGEEASLFAADLARMYLRFAQRRGWTVTLVDEATSELGGFKSLTFTVNGKGAYTALKHEAGVHRVQRIPDTEKSGRIHTSTVTVAVLEKPKVEEFKVPAQDLRIDTMRASGPGGQFVNRRESAVRVLHIPTGIMVTSQAARTQMANREQAMQILLAKLAERKREEDEKNTGAMRKAQIGTGERAEKIRTYNFPQDRITDHRVGKSWKNLKEVLDGNLDKITEALQTLPTQ